MRRAEKLWLLAVLLLLALAGSAVGWFITALGAGLCEGQGPGECEARQNDPDIWLGAAILLLVVLIVTVARALEATRAERDDPDS